MGKYVFQNFLKFQTVVYRKCDVQTSQNHLCLLLYLFNLQTTPKSCKYVDQKTQDNFSCKHENTCKSMEIPTLWKYFWSLTSPLTLMGKYVFQNFLKFQTVVYRKCDVQTSQNHLCLLLYLFNLQTTPKSCKYVDQKTQDNFSCKHENTCKSMEIPTLWKYFWSLTIENRI